MKATIKVSKEVDIKYLRISAKVRYWENATVNGVSDSENGDLIPCKEGNLWMPLIDIDEGRIINWRHGTTADVYYKVCDQGEYFLLDADQKVILSLEDGEYVPNRLIPERDDYGDYITMKIDETGTILNWYKHPSIDEFISQE